MLADVIRISSNWLTLRHVTKLPSIMSSFSRNVVLESFGYRTKLLEITLKSNTIQTFPKNWIQNNYK